MAPASAARLTGAGPPGYRLPAFSASSGGQSAAVAVRFRPMPTTSHSSRPLSRSVPASVRMPHTFLP